MGLIDMINNQVDKDYYKRSIQSLYTEIQKQKSIVV